MRRNLPISQREFPFPAGQTLVSVTDPAGRIVHCNDAFVHVSGFARGELLGQPHNLVRHPDMPPQAFGDLWATIGAGQPWTGVIKNRRKDGDHYWVQANVTPMKNGERITGYLSVRTQPARADVAAAEALYRCLREDAAAGRRRLVLRQGRVWRRGIAGLLQRLRHPGLAAQLVLVQAAATAALLAVGAGPVTWPALAGALACAALAAAAAWHLAVRPLHALVADANRLAAGDLAHPVARDGHGAWGALQRALQQVAVNLRTVVGDTRGDIAQVDHASGEIAAGNHDLSARTEAQAGSLQQSAASLEQISSSARQSAEAAGAGARLAQQAAAIARDSHAAVQAMAHSMGGIAEASQRIHDITGVVEGVAFQTRILSLNAAIEAARAGDAGRGFAVVAEQVRALALRSADASQEIKALIGTCSERVVQGSAAAQAAQARMHEAVQAVTAVDTVLDQVATATAEQQGGIAQISQAVTHLDGITQQNAAMVEQLSAAALSLQGQVAAVNRSMRLFRLSTAEPTMVEAEAAA